MYISVGRVFLIGGCQLFWQKWQTVICDRKSVCMECGKVKHQGVLQLTLLASALLPVNFVLKLDVLLTI